jgi:hypothetical protein
MADELYFPPVGPDLVAGQEHRAENGVTYTWTPNFSTWMIGSSQQVNKDYVDARDQLRLRVDGFNHMYGDLTLRENATVNSDIGAQLTQSGVLRLHSNKAIQFVGDGGTISVSGQDFLAFSNSEVQTKKPIAYDRSMSTFQKYTGSNTRLTLVDISSSSSITTSIALSKGSNSYFSIVKSGSTSDLFTIRNNGEVRVSSSGTIPFAVGGSLFRVYNDKTVLVSSDLNNRLINSSNSVVEVSDQCVATKGYVDSKSVKAGYPIVADKESEAEINGFWRNGNNLYLRIS